MLNRVSALLFWFILLTGLIVPCVAQEQQGAVLLSEAADTAADAISEEAVQADDAAVVNDESSADNNTNIQEEAEESQAPVQEETSSGIPTLVKKDTKEVVEKRSVVDTLVYNFEKTFIRDSRWKLFVEGFGNTVLIALCSTLLGVLIGMIIAVVKVLHAQIDRPNVIVNIFNFIFNIYTTVIRGTPAVVQLFIAYYIIFKNTDNYILVSIFAFGINSGAYVSEIVRGGILSIDRGQLEAGRSLGLSYITTMVSIVLPQAIKNILPSLANELITMIKESSLCGAIGMYEIMWAAKTTAGATFLSMSPYMLAAAIYFCINYPAGKLIELLERRMRRGDKR